MTDEDRNQIIAELNTMRFKLDNDMSLEEREALLHKIRAKQSVIDAEADDLVRKHREREHETRIENGANWIIAVIVGLVICLQLWTSDSSYYRGALPNCPGSAGRLC